MALLMPKDIFIVISTRSTRSIVHHRSAFILLLASIAVVALTILLRHYVPSFLRSSYGSPSAPESDCHGDGDEDSMMDGIVRPRSSSN